MASPYLDDGDLVFYLGDCVEVMRGLSDASVDAVVCDPPYGLEFMGKDWDSFRGSSAAHADARQRRAVDIADPSKGAYIRSAVNAYEAGRPFQAWCEVWAVEALRVLKPGGHLAAFGGTRTYHRLACAVEDAGFEVRDSLCWLYGSGFPKSLDVSKAIDKAAGAEREPGRVLVSNGKRGAVPNTPGNSTCEECGKPSWGHDYCRCPRDGGAATAAAATWDGWGTALKPAYEPIVLARKPLVGTVAANVQAHGVGALNIDACRIGMSAEDADFIRRTARPNSAGEAHEGAVMNRPPAPTVNVHEAGRWPANVVLDEAAAEMLDEQSGERASGGRAAGEYGGIGTGAIYGNGDTTQLRAIEANTGGASRFFYTAKASRSERGDDNTHPTVKPVALMRWLIRLVTPPGGLVLDPFCGSGTTPLAARQEGYRCIAIDREVEYLGIAARRTAQLSLLAEGGAA